MWSGNRKVCYIQLTKTHVCKYWTIFISTEFFLLYKGLSKNASSDAIKSLVEKRQEYLYIWCSLQLYILNWSLFIITLFGNYQWYNNPCHVNEALPQLLYTNTLFTFTCIISNDLYLVYVFIDKSSNSI